MDFQKMVFTLTGESHIEEIPFSISDFQKALIETGVGLSLRTTIIRNGFKTSPRLDLRPIEDFETDSISCLKNVIWHNL